MGITYNEFEQAAMDKCGFFITFVPPETKDDLVNIHTRGVPESFGHEDFQIALALSMEMAHSVMHYLVDEVKKGRVFSVGDTCDTVFQGGVIVDFVHARECERQVLRVIIPDNQKNRERSKMAPPFDRQWEDTYLY